MTYQLWLFITAIVYFTYFQNGRADDKVNDDLTCVMTYKNWASPARLIVNWTNPRLTVDPEDLNINITWYTMYNIGSCPDILPTSCAWNYGRAMSFNFNFNVSVIITEKWRKIFNKEWDVNPDDCRKPPSVDHVVAESINSTCVNISWWYNEMSKCSTFDSKFYQISFGKKDETEFTIYDPANRTLVTACHSNRIICNLQPFTTNVFNIQVKLGDWEGKIRGHFSDSKLTTCITPEDVPAGAPEVARGGFSLVENECVSDNIRTIRIYWKDVSSDLKHGNITHFLIDIRTLPDSGAESAVTQTIEGGKYSSLITLNCSTEYEIRLKAETSIGVSSVCSSLFIPETSQSSQSAIENVIPVIAIDSFHVYWLEDTDVDASQSEEHRVFWCFKDVNNLCKSPINWTEAPKNSSYAKVAVQPGSPPHSYRFGVSYADVGITWSNCHYTKTEDLRRPVGLKLKSDDMSPDGSMTISWDNDPCESHPPGPFIGQFVISICKVKDSSDDKICKAESSERFVGAERNSYLFTDLDTSAMYMVCIHTIGLSRKQHGNSSCINGQPAGHRSVMSRALVAVCVMVTAFLLSCAIYGGVKCNERLIRQLRMCKERFRITIPHDNLEFDGQHITIISLSDTPQRPLLT